MDLGALFSLAAVVLFGVAAAPAVDAAFDAAALADAGWRGEVHYPDRHDPTPDHPDAAWPCDQPIRVLINLEHAPAGAADMVDRALSEVAEASGHEFTTPESTEMNLSATPDGTMWIGWLPNDDPIWTKDRTVGLGGGIVMPGLPPQIVVGHVIVRAGAGLNSDPSRPDSHQLVLLHEILHALGVPHVGDPDAVMYPQTGAVELNQSDLSAIQSVGCSG